MNTKIYFIITLIHTRNDECNRSRCTQGILNRRRRDNSRISGDTEQASQGVDL